MRKPNVGETLFLVHDRQRAGKHTSLATVSKVGRKYFYLDNGVHGELAFHLDTWRYVTDYNKNEYIVYETEQAYLDEVELETLKWRFKRTFDWADRQSVTLDQARRIQAILDEPKPSQEG